ncbi:MULTISPECIES: endonuclease/exonuclease/phosphatase family protein [Sphingobacterium]|uniref:endonuclease/exonuclease/phosphatase family protein n=1 Tax=Sphingobacterium TaxID=28453 RepID=UPI0013DA26DD|nr:MULTISPECIES: endonuclease/exonuclease/phosphatase family protein [unclassified Sphingobacterium]
MVYFYSVVVLLFVFFLKFKNAKKISICAEQPLLDLDDFQRGELRVLTYNTAGLPQHISSASTPRRTSIALIGKYLNSYDIVNLQEDFNYNKSLYSTTEHRYKTLHKGRVLFGDGLSTLSRFPIVEYRRIPWTSWNGSDCLTPKGFSYSQIQLSKKITIDVYNLHANAHDNVRSAQVRRKNLDQLARYIHDHSSERPLLVMGDFNAHYAHGLDNLFDFLKIMFRNSTHFKFEPTLYAIDRTIFKDDTSLPLSDHLAVIVNLKWEWTS